MPETFELVPTLAKRANEMDTERVDSRLYLFCRDFILATDAEPVTSFDHDSLQADNRA
jgi:hypothetical protein